MLFFYLIFDCIINIGIALIIFGLLAFVFVTTLPHSHYNPEKESSTKTTAKATKATTPTAPKTKTKKEKEDTGSAPPTPKGSSRKKVAPKVVEESPVASAKPRTRGIHHFL